MNGNRNTPYIVDALSQVEAELKAAAKNRSPEWLQNQLLRGSYVYGAGSFGRRIVRLLKERGFPCSGVLDRRAGEGLSNVDDTPVLHPKDMTPQMCCGHNFILGIFNPFDDMGEIVNSVRQSGFEQILWGADLPDALGPSLNDFWLRGRRVFIESFDRIRLVSEILADRTSIETLLSVIGFRALDKAIPDPPPSFGTQYLPSDLPGFDGPISFLDGGSYDGDTFRSLVGFGVKIENWLAFEPDAANFTKLVEFAQHAKTRATLIPCGLSDRAHQVRFAAGNETGSRILENEVDSGTTIQCISIDGAFHDTPIDYVKLDIEGAERAALKGMEKTIQKYRPRLAISAYHRPHDLWEIPLQMKSILPDSDIYLRQHYPNTYEVVAYAIPRTS